MRFGQVPPISPGEHQRLEDWRRAHRLAQENGMEFEPPEDIPELVRRSFLNKGQGPPSPGPEPGGLSRISRAIP